jgi:endoplasmic reticulum Man9GlcNAc2 1,2-alpha-mannosidase
MRPEALETLFILYRTTKDPKYQDWAYEIFLSIQKYSRVQYGLIYSIL